MKIILSIAMALLFIGCSSDNSSKEKEAAAATPAPVEEKSATEQAGEKLAEAKDIMVSLGRAGKMPCPTYNTPAKLCKTGSKLRKIKGTTCHGCYAMKGNYLFPTVQQGLQKRFDAFKHPRFVEAMTFMVNRYSAKSGYFRWFDSGDIADMAMLEKIVMGLKMTDNAIKKIWLTVNQIADIDL